ncbi:DUF4296 domain-containing protein [Flavobacterium sp. j3]|jgi:hypothetical protein|uniref:DUF4296 domain-containing protein n=1 Tax=Flavobacterium aureirubrum TaxID=3133147 RepID=A0ABU9N2B3_9FLAO
MKKTIALLCLLFSIYSCTNAIVEKPKNLIEKDKMIDILYDLSLLDAIKSQNINGGISSKTVENYIFKKYKIDSIQLAKSNTYYASDIDEYKKMIEEVKTRLSNETLKIDKTLKNNNQSVSPSLTRQPLSDTPQVQ